MRGFKQLSSAERSLQALKARPLEITPKALLELWRQYEVEFKDEWKLRALLTAALCERIIAVSFHPTGLKKPQILYAMKGEELKNIPGFMVPHFEDPNLLNVKYLAFDLSTISLGNSLKTIGRISDQYKKEIRATLLRFKEDPETQGLSLTIRNEDGELKTYVWFKRVSTK